VRHVVGFVVAFVALWWFWLLLVGEWNHQEWIAATAAAAVGALVFEVARARADVAGTVSLARLREVPPALLMVFVDFVALVGVLAAVPVRRSIPRGRFVRRTTTGTESPAARAWIAVVAGFSPSAYVVDVTEERVLLHRLAARRASEKPA